jgi:hypothetical protein
MKFGEILEHLGRRGYATRKLWRGRSTIVFGMDNCLCQPSVDRKYCY